MQKALFIVIAIGLVFGGAYVWKNSSPTMPDAAPIGAAGQNPVGEQATEVPVATIYFYGEECPHCKDVMKFLDENKIADKVKFEKKEVWHDTANAAMMEDRAKLCGLDVKKIGVPFLFAEGKCFIGTPDVESYFKTAAGL
jgi:glutaredoxin